MTSLGNTQPNSNLEIVSEFYQRFFNEADISVVDELIAKDYIQHNPSIPNGRDAIKPFVADGPFPAYIKWIGSEGDLVFVQVEYPIIKTAAFDIFRLNNGIIQEHWDVQATIKEPLISPTNGNAIFGASSNKHSEASLETNKAVIQKLYAEFFNEGKANILDEIMAENYIQHNYGIANGRESIKVFVNDGPFVAEIKRMLAFRDYVVVHVYYPSIASVAVDLYRLEQNQIVEHWDVMQQLTNAEETVSGNPMF